MHAIAHHLAAARPPYRQRPSAPVFMRARTGIEARDVFKAVRDHYAGTSKVGGRWRPAHEGCRQLLPAARAASPGQPRAHGAAARRARARGRSTGAPARRRQPTLTCPAACLWRCTH